MISQIFIKEHLLNRTIISYLLYPFSLIYASIQLIYRFIYLLFPVLSYQSKIKIISIGNLVSGGTGKTPLTIFIASVLKKKGYKIAISNRGYKGKFEQTNKLISNYNEVFSWASEAGDEPYMIARKLMGIPVIVGRNRKASIQILERDFPELDFVILDDSFQHHKVKKDVNILIFNSLNLTGNGFVLPAGILREPLFCMNYADIIILNGKSEIKLPQAKNPLFQAEYVNPRVYDADQKEIPLISFATSKNVLLSGIGLPESFEETINRIGIPFIKHIKFQDHYNYNNPEFADTLNILTKVFDFIIVTEKDFVKIHKLPNFSHKVIYLKIELKIHNNEELFKMILAKGVSHEKS